YITGRAKDVIIVNGVNHYSHEIESCAEELPYAVRSFTAAVAVRTDPTASTDELALFFHPEPGHDLTQALRAIRGKITREIGVSPAFLVPVEAATIPKTEIGKIQRTQLRKRFEAGEFDTQVQQSEILLGTAATVPDWFLHPVWQRAESPHRPVEPARHTLILAGCGALAVDVADAVADGLRRRGALATVVTAGEGYDRLDAGRYRVRTDAVEDYDRLLAGLAADGRPVDAVLHLGAFTARHRDRQPDSVAALLTAQRDSADSLLCLARALTTARPRDHRVRLHLVTRQDQEVLPQDHGFYGHAAAGGLLKSLSEELPWLSACWVDVPAGDLAQTARLILAEASVPITEAEVAHRAGRRWVRRLAPLPQPLPQTAPVTGEGFHLISGGLGGVAVRLAEHLLKTPGTRLLLVGRTELPEEHTWDAHLAAGGENARRIAAYRTLRERGDVRYAAADVTDAAQVRAAVDKAAAEWSAPLAGVLHLAGEFGQRAASEYGVEEWRAALAAKVTGGWVLHRLALAHSATSFLSFSSVNGYFGGSMSGAYSAANAFLDALAVHQRRHCGLDARSVAWSMWEELGMSRGFGLKELTEARGYRVLDESAALRSFGLARSLDLPHVLVGVDRGAPWVRGHVRAPARAVHRLVAEVAFRQGADVGEVYQGAVGAARSAGAADRWVLRAAGSSPGSAGPAAAAAAGGPVAPDAARQRALREQVSAIWCQVLERDQVGAGENFFDLGGNSLLLVKAQAAVNRQLGCDLSVVDLFRHPTVEALSRHLADSGRVPAAERTPAPERPGAAGPAPDSALERARQQAQRRRAARQQAAQQSKRNQHDG
ncbi:SDR family NAD(P)-dependent oxidoreductase, partial [Streptomyces stramineus]|uniref:SDR family NAD(P)-dependent oxidoreductase n=1 Tax=Streptomyces stramineus TaxID=173861 RepID=UPI0031D6E1E7